MSGSVPSRFDDKPEYGWSAEGKTKAEISSDIRQTRYRLDSDVRALRELLTFRELFSAAVVAGVFAGLSFLIRKLRRR
jgi:hypothetical protein